MFEFAAPKSPKLSLPSLRYALFDKLFEARVEEVQKEIRDIEKLQRPYGIVRAALIEANLPNDSDVKLYPGLMVITIEAVPTDRIADLESGAVDRITKGLVEAKLYDSEEAKPATSHGGAELTFCYVWSCWRSGGDDRLSIILRIHIPKTGLADVAVEREKRTYETSVWKLIRTA